mmetsp:Transcript_47491/g.93650  ORF Transcript_47491/g.93650 Transcript_47491/m.93650 type:complete len:227 (-) Transcript_47491:206-886(-)
MNLFCRHCICLEGKFFETFLFFIRRTLGNSLLDFFLKKFVCSETFSIRFILYHQISETLNMPRHLQNFLWSHTSSPKLQHPLVEDKVPSPISLKLRLHRTPRRPKIKQPRNPPIDFKSRGNEEASLQQGLQPLSALCVERFQVFQGFLSLRKVTLQCFQFRNFRPQLLIPRTCLLHLLHSIPLACNVCTKAGGRLLELSCGFRCDAGHFLCFSGQKGLSLFCGCCF